MSTILLYVTLRSNNQAQAYFSLNYKSLVVSTTANLEICGQENTQPTGTPPNQFSFYIGERSNVHRTTSYKVSRPIPDSTVTLYINHQLKIFNTGATNDNRVVDIDNFDVKLSTYKYKTNSVQCTCVLFHFTTYVLYTFIFAYLTYF